MADSQNTYRNNIKSGLESWFSENIGIITIILGIVAAIFGIDSIFLAPEREDLAWETAFSEGYHYAEGDLYNKYYEEGYLAAEEEHSFDWQNGFDTGWSEGYNDGQNEDYDVIWDDGYSSGYNKGYSTGYNEGYTKGKADEKSSSKSSYNSNNYYSGSNNNTNNYSTNNEKEYSYVLNKNTKKFHYSNCRSVKQMDDKNKKFHTGTRSEVIEMGYSPCGNCHP